jgi:hypothetical protein
MDRIARLSYNLANWHHPTGEAGAHEKGGTYNNVHGFGHEDWLFRNEWTLDGWRYAFIQGVGKSRAALLKDNRPFNVTLFTVEPDKRKRYVAQIREAEALDDYQAERALEAFRSAGWLATMEQEIRDIGGNSAALEDASQAAHILNVRFRVENVKLLPSDIYAKAGDPILGAHRYQLYIVKPFNHSEPRSRRTGSTLPPNLASFLRKATGEVTVSPEHAMMQAKLMKQLRAENPAASIEREKNYIDVLMETPTTLYLYEIKSDLSPSTVLRLAIGQLLEYAFHLDNPKKKMIVLVAVGRVEPSYVDENFVKQLREQYGMPLEYRAITH